MPGAAMGVNRVALSSLCASGNLRGVMEASRITEPRARVESPWAPALSRFHVRWPRAEGVLLTALAATGWWGFWELFSEQPGNARILFAPPIVVLLWRTLARPSRKPLETASVMGEVTLASVITAAAWSFTPHTSEMDKFGLPLLGVFSGAFFGALISPLVIALDRRRRGPETCRRLDAWATLSMYSMAGGLLLYLEHLERVRGGYLYALLLLLALAVAAKVLLSERAVRAFVADAYAGRLGGLRVVDPPGEVSPDVPNLALSLEGPLDALTAPGAAGYRDGAGRVVVAVIPRVVESGWRRFLMGEVVLAVLAALAWEALR